MKAKYGLFSIILIILIIGVAAFGIYHYSAYKKFEKEEQERLIAEQQAQEEEQARLAAEQAELAAIREQLISGNFNEDLKVVFLTFDDGPNEYTNEVLDILAANNVKATFFTNGRTDPEDIAAYQRIVNEGHVLGNHTWSHDYSNYNNTSWFLEDVNKLHDYQTEITGVEPIKVFRFPGGSNITDSVNTEAILAEGYNYFDWTASAGDGGGVALTGQETLSKMLTEVYARPQAAVILTHAESPNNFATREALDPLIKTLQSQGYTFMTLDPEYNLIKFI